ncbi:hypothetical protein BDA99DRAFT_541005 [Phascolomyces articulosus]|uniref:Uncharacterized protein n=1 Tax=Phascolomyces articulosus TaxID=60185 RepID=A0AAD5PA62_9FUNG|nr:hypothetical protein BDA99DRAFT_541005 [Phascolomyces articulosus]
MDRLTCQRIFLLGDVGSRAHPELLHQKAFKGHLLPLEKLHTIKYFLDSKVLILDTRSIYIASTQGNELSWSKRTIQVTNDSTSPPTEHKISSHSDRWSHNKFKRNLDHGCGSMGVGFFFLYATRLLDVASTSTPDSSGIDARTATESLVGSLVLGIPV